MMPIKWADSAHQDILAILEYFAEKQEKDIGQKILDRLFEALELLAKFPKAGRLGRVEGTRELLIPKSPYILVYTVTEQVEIVRLLYTRQGRE